MVTLIKDFFFTFWLEADECFSAVLEWLHVLILGKEEESGPDTVPFVASEYLDRIEKASLDILEAQKPVDRTIVLWWGLGGLRLNEDGASEWISRRKPEPVNQNVFYQPCQTRSLRESFDMCQSPQSQIDALRLQIAQQMCNTSLITTMQSYTTPYPSYLYGGTMYSSQLTNCCCNQQWR